jgi:carbon monoxide dehydrogenase subunit G
MNMTSRKADWSKRTANKTAGTTVTLDDRVLVPTSADVAWTRLEDIPLVAACLPGLDPSTLVHEGDGAFRARMTNTVMGISANWDLRATMRPDAHRRLLNVVLDGEDSKLNMKLHGTADVVVRAEDEAQSTLDYTANLRIDGSLAAMGGPIIRSILADAIAQFVSVVGGRTEPERIPWYVRARQTVRSWWRRLTGRRDAAAN